MKNKKAFFFTLTIIFCITLLLLLSFSYRKEYTKESVQTRLVTANSFVEAVEGDAERAIYISGYRTVLGLLDYVSSRGYVPEDLNYSELFKDAFINGTLKIDDYNDSRLFEGLTLADWENETITKANQFGLLLSFGDSVGVFVGQSEPWNIDVNVTLEYNLSDTHLSSVWSRRTIIPGKIPIYSLEDPIYVQGFGKDVANIIHRTPYTTFVSYSCDANNLTAHINTDGLSTGSYYVSSSNAPNFLDRLKGLVKNADAGTGIESIINAQRIGRLLIPGKSLVDHSYFNCDDCSFVKITGAPSWLVLSSEEATSVYNIPSGCITSL